MGDVRMPTGDHGLGHALETVATRAETASGVLVCADFDGTLAPITDRPADARPVPESVRQLRRLHESERATVAVVSGRELVDLQSRLAIDGIVYAGNHGIERHVGGETTVHADVHGYRDATRRVRDALDRAYRLDSDLLVEDKGWSVTVHYRTAATGRAPQLRDEVETVAQTVGDGQLRTEHVKQAIEVRPDIDWDTGACVESLVSEAPADYLPIYLGDDETDRPGFRAAERHGGVSVGVDRADAQTRVDSPQDVTVLLRWLVNSGLGRSHTEPSADRPRSA
jgi:trehalose 6-phosphate phosphatase